MFHIKSLELVHWDYWQRIKNIPLDAKIITIAGQNGSGKTTLLDALRTLFGLDCSMGRTYKHYARHSGQQSAWIRAVVDNAPVGRQLSNRPFRHSGFFSDDEVTLFCQVQKNGGDWKRQYLMRPGNVEIEEVTEATDWLGVENYRKRLASAGLSPAMSKVLALEQGETDKLCEYAPRQLLDLVFQVFGDKEVLDAYDEAKRHQRDTETELKRFEAELETSRINLEGLRLRVANYHQWEDLHKEKRDLKEEVLPALEYHEAREKSASMSRNLREARKPLVQADSMAWAMPSSRRARRIRRWASGSGIALLPCRAEMVAISPAILAEMASRLPFWRASSASFSSSCLATSAMSAPASAASFCRRSRCSSTLSIGLRRALTWFRRLASSVPSCSSWVSCFCASVRARCWAASCWRFSARIESACSSGLRASLRLRLMAAAFSRAS